MTPTEPSPLRDNNTRVETPLELAHSTAHSLYMCGLTNKPYYCVPLIEEAIKLHSVNTRPALLAHLRAMVEIVGELPKSQLSDAEAAAFLNASAALNQSEK